MTNVKKFYFLILFILIVAFFWIYIIKNQFIPKELNFCFIKSVSGFPCPTCGATRSLIFLLNGYFLKSLLTNPLGVLYSLLILFLPIWILFDLIFNQKTLFNFYNSLKLKINNKKFYIILIILICINWIWNIKKGL